MSGRENGRQSNLSPIIAGVLVRQRLRSQVVSLMTCLLIAQAAGVQTEQANSDSIPIPDLREMAIQIKAGERKLHNLKVRSELWVDESVDPNDPFGVWEQTPAYVSSTMWSDVQPGGKIRVDVHNQVLRWVKDERTVSYSERSFSQSFDGHLGRTVMKRRGTLGDTVRVTDGVVTSPGRPRELDDIWSRQYTGRYFTTSSFRLNEQGTFLSDLLSLAENPKSLATEHFDFTWETLNGIECVKISVKESKAKDWSKRWWLDPARGFALLRYEYVRILENGTKVYRILMEIHELKQLTEGVWWPMKATSIIEPLRPGEPYTRIRYHASDVTANDPKFDESLFAQLD